MSEYHCEECGELLGVGAPHQCNPADVSSWRRARAYDHLAASADPQQCEKCYRLLSTGHVCDQGEIDLAKSMEREVCQREANSLWTAFHYLSSLSWSIPAGKQDGFREAMGRLRDRARELEAG